ncbi:MAG: OprD family outer membrane porin [Syntrophaceae bacterium]
MNLQLIILVLQRAMIILAVMLGTVLFHCVGSPPVMAQEAVSLEGPPPSSVEDIVTPMDKSFEKPPDRVRPYEKLKEVLKDSSPFFRDMKLDINLRTYYLYHENFDGNKNEAWTLGGSIVYKSGYLFDHFGVGAAFYTSQPFYAPDDRDGTLLLKPGQEGYSVLGQLYGEIKLVENIFIDLYRKEYNTPFINKNDSRMTPNTFEGYTLVGRYGGKDGAPESRYGGGYITRINPRNSDDFIPMSQAAGAQVDRGVALAGVNYISKEFSIGAIDYYSEDIINIFYTEGRYTLPLKDRFGVFFSAQLTDQRSTGDDLLTGSSFSTHQAGFKGETSYHGALLSLAYTNATKGADLRSPWGGYPGYTSVQIKDFNRAGEEAIMVKVSYDLSGLGLEGITAYALWVHGWGALDSGTKAPVYNQDEYNLDLQWRPKGGLKGLWFRIRYAYVDQRGGSDSFINDFRIIVNYDFSLL